MPELFAFHKDTFTGDIYDFSIVSGGEIGAETRIYTFLRSIIFSAVSDTMGRMLVYFPVTQSDLRPLMQIRNFKDASGTEVVPGGEWLMTEFEPVLNMFNRVHAYRSRCSVNVTGDD